MRDKQKKRPAPKWVKRQITVDVLVGENNQCQVMIGDLELGLPVHLDHLLAAGFKA